MSGTTSVSELSSMTDPDAARGFARRRPALLAPAMLLRAEGAVLTIVATALYARTGMTWWLFALLLLVPDLGLLGYLAGARIGAASYNLTHALVLPGLVGLWGWWIGSSPLVAVALVWIAHIGVDRMVGYGLKYESSFRDTHLQRVADR
jgi:hypothetical protein